MKTIGKIFIIGLFTVLPILATVYLIVWFFAGAERFIGAQGKVADPGRILPLRHGYRGGSRGRIYCRPADARVAYSPRAPGQRILTGPRFARLYGYGLIMAVGTLGLFHYAQPRGETYALTLAFTTFVLFQFFNVFNARAEHGTAFKRGFFSNRWLWLALVAVLVLQVLAVHWAPTQAIFRITDLAHADWGLAFAAGASVLLLEEGRTLAVWLWRRPAGERGAIA